MMSLRYEEKRITEMKHMMSFNYDSGFFTALDNFDIKSTADSCGESAVRGETLKEESCVSGGKYSIFDIADWFLLKSNMTHKKLQKLCYYAQAWCYALRGYPLANTDFEARSHGPVSPALYERFKGFGFGTIRMKTARTPAIEKEDELLLQDVWDTYGDMTGNALEALTHRELSRIEAGKGDGEAERSSVAISVQSMKDYYKSIYLK